MGLLSLSERCGCHGPDCVLLVVVLTIHFVEGAREVSADESNMKNIEF